MGRLIILGLCAALAACSVKKESAENAMNVDEAVVENLAVENAAADTNAVADENVADMNAMADENVADANAADMNAVDANAPVAMANGNDAAHPYAYTVDDSDLRNELVAMADGDDAANAVANAPVENATANPPVENAVANAPADAKVEKGVGAFVDPPRMKVAKWYMVKFVVAPKAKGPSDMTAGTLEEEAGGQSLTAPTTVFLSPQMRVTLTSGPNLKIEPKSKDVQPTGLDKSATWQWAVSPQTSGEHELSALVEPLDAQGKALDSYTRYVKVQAEATIGQQIDEVTSFGEKLTKFFKSWQGAVLALAAFIGAVFFLVRTIRNRGRDAPEPPSGEEKHDG